MSAQSENLKLKVVSIFHENDFQISVDGLDFILGSPNPIELAAKCIGRAKEIRPRPSVITADIIKIVTKPADEEVAAEILNKLEKGDSLQDIFTELQMSLGMDSLAVAMYLEKMWFNGILPLHKFEAHFYTEFLINKKLQEMYAHEKSHSRR